MNLNNSVICLLGPTASGKTDIAVELKQHLPIELISVDSSIVYRGLDIGAGKPDACTLERAPHYLIDICDPVEPYNAALFRKHALEAITEIQNKGKIPLLVGGTMMYFKALFDGLSPLPESNPSIRSEIEEQASKHGWPALYQKLKQVDSVTAARLEPQDAQRIGRALEVFHLTGKPMAEILANAQPEPLPYKTQVYGFIPTDSQRKHLHNRIEQRFNKMLEMGLIEEVQALYAREDLSLATPAMRAVGYRQVWEYLEGQYDYQTMVAKAVAATRQLAKRQITWLRSWPNLQQVDFFYSKIIDRLINDLDQA